MNKILITLLLGIFLFSFASADSIGTYKVNEQMQITNYCQVGTCTYMNLSSIELPNGTILNYNVAMTKYIQDFSYSYTPDLLGTYTFYTCGNPDAEIICDKDTFNVTSTGESGSMFYIILLSCIAVIFLIASIFVDEEFFVYISGISFLLGGIYIMINGLDILNNQGTRNLSYIYIGIGLLFTLGAYVYNSYSKNEDREESY